MGDDYCWSCCCCCCLPDGSGSDLGGEYARQRNYLEKTIDSLKRKLAADAEAHRTDELRIMGQNVSLIRELNELRREIKVCVCVEWVTGGGGQPACGTVLLGVACIGPRHVHTAFVGLSLKRQHHTLFCLTLKLQHTHVEPHTAISARPVCHPLTGAEVFITSAQPSSHQAPACHWHDRQPLEY